MTDVTRILADIERGDGRAAVRCSADRAVVVTDDFCDDVVDLLGPQSFELCGTAGATRRS